MGAILLLTGCGLHYIHDVAAGAQPGEFYATVTTRGDAGLREVVLLRCVDEAVGDEVGWRTACHRVLRAGDAARAVWSPGEVVVAHPRKGEP